VATGDERGQPSVASVPVDLAVATYAAKWRRLDELAIEYMASALVALGLFQSPGERFTAEQVCESTGILPVYRSLLPRWLQALTRAGRITQEGDGFSAPAPLPGLSPAELEARGS